MKKILFPLILFFLLLGSPPAEAAPASGGDWAKAIRENYAGFNTMHATFSQKITHGESGVTEDRQGEIFFRKPLLIRWLTKPPAEETLVVTDKLIWQYFPQEALAYKYPLTALDEKNAFLQVLFGLSSLDESFSIKVLPDENGLAKLRLDPYEPTASLVEAILWLDKKDAMIKRLAIRDFYGNLNEISMTKIERNAAIPAGTFEFAPPPGTEIEDRR